MFNQHFYHQLTRKYVTAFGSIFNNVTLVKYNQEHTTEIKRTKVPIVYGPREKYLVKINEDNRLVQSILPVMSFNLAAWLYQPTRKTNSLHRHPRANTISGNADYTYHSVPYDLTFELSIMARNKDDALQILEQILPSFNPDFTFSQILIPELGFVKDIPVRLESINWDTNYETDFEEIISVEVQLQFTMMAHYYGPVVDTKIIRTAFANTFIDPSLYSGAIIRVNTANGNNGVYNIEDLVFQGNTLNYSTAAGVVIRWDSTNQYLILGGVQGQFLTNTTIKAASTNAEYNLVSFDMSPLKVESIKVEPDPITANVGDPFGFNETLQEFPDTLD